MIVISDTNVIYSAQLTPNGTIAKIISAKKKFKIVAPNYLLEEIEEHFDEIVAQSKTLNYKELKELLDDYKQKIQFIAIDDIPSKTIQIAYNLVKDIDEEDVFFVALAIYKQCKLWTTDRTLANKLKAKGFKKIITTKELKLYLYKK